MSGWRTDPACNTFQRVKLQPVKESHRKQPNQVNNSRQETAASRNSFGWDSASSMTAPKQTRNMQKATTKHTQAEKSRGTFTPYLIIAVIILLLALFVYYQRNNSIVDD